MKVSALLLLTLTLVVNGADRSLRGGDTERDLEDREGPSLTITSGYYDFEAEIEVTFELVDGGCRRNLRNVGNKGQTMKAERAAEQEAKEARVRCEYDPDSCDDNGVDDFIVNPYGIDAIEDVRGKAFGNGALTALTRAVKKKVTMDTGLLEGVEATNATVTMQEIVNVKSENGKENGRHLSWGGEYLRLYLSYKGTCNGCGGGNSDHRSLEVLNRRNLLAEDPQLVNEACSELARKVLNAAGAGHELLSNIDRIGLKLIVPGIPLTDPITCWYPTPPGKDANPC